MVILISLDWVRYNLALYVDDVIPLKMVLSSGGGGSLPSTNLNAMSQWNALI